MKLKKKQSDFINYVYGNHSFDMQDSYERVVIRVHEEQKYRSEDIVLLNIIRVDFQQDYSAYLTKKKL